MTTITLTDEQGIGNKTLEKPFDVVQDSLTLLELLRLRVYGEAEAHNAEGDADFSGLVQPEGGPKRRVDAEAQFHKAVEAFERRAFIVLVDDEQVDRLETVLNVTSRTRVTFLKLVPLVGG